MIKRKVLEILLERQEYLRRVERENPAGPLPLPSDDSSSFVGFALGALIGGYAREVASTAASGAGLGTVGMFDDSSLDEGRDRVYSALYAPSSVQLSSWFRVQVHLYDRRIARSVSRKAKALDKHATLKGETALSM